MRTNFNYKLDHECPKVVQMEPLNSLSGIRFQVFLNLSISISTKNRTVQN
jgi:hypothetical protein